MRISDWSSDVFPSDLFWIAVPLFILSLTGAWISFPKFFAPLGGDKMEQRGRPGADPMARFRAQPLDEPVQPLATVVRDGATLASGRLASIESSDERRVGKECVSTGRAGESGYN